MDDEHITIQLRSIYDAVQDIKQRLERHEAAHIALAEKQAEKAVRLEHRITALEAAKRQDRWIGGLGILGNAILAALGLTRPGA